MEAVRLVCTTENAMIADPRQWAYGINTPDSFENALSCVGVDVAGYFGVAPARGAREIKHISHIVVI